MLFRYLKSHETSHVWKDCLSSLKTWLWKEKVKSPSRSLRTRVVEGRLEEEKGGSKSKISRSDECKDISKK